MPAQYYVCHKCGLPRISKDGPDLGFCACLGQTEFEYERQPRTLEQAASIGVQNFVSVITLYTHQGLRDEHDFMRIVRKYTKVLQAYDELKNMGRITIPLFLGVQPFGNPKRKKIEECQETPWTHVCGCVDEMSLAEIPIVSETYVNMTKEEKQFVWDTILEVFVYCPKCKNGTLLKNAKHIVGDVHEWFCPRRDCGAMVAWKKL